MSRPSEGVDEVILSYRCHKNTSSVTVTNGTHADITLFKFNHLINVLLKLVTYTTHSRVKPKNVKTRNTLTDPSM
jgi:hypothetical protein